MSYKRGEFMKNFIEQLTNIGLTEYEAKAYYAMLQKSGLSASELSKLAGVPRTRIYEVVNNLINKGFCTQLEGKIKKFKAISPQFAFTDLIENYEDELTRKRNAINDLSQNLQPIYDNEKEADTNLDYLEIIKERNHVLEKINRLGDTASEEIMTMNKPPYAVNFELACERGTVMHNPNLKYKFVSEKEDLKDPNFVKFLQLWENIGAEIRIVDEVPVKLVIFDQRAVLFSLPEKVSTTPKYTSLIIDHEALAKLYVKIFNVYFSEGITIKEFLEQQNKGETL